MTLRFHLDEHVPPAVAMAMRQDRLDVTTTAEAGLGGAPDEAQIAYGLTTGHVIITFDADFLAMARRGVTHAGIMFCPRGARSVARIAERAVLIHACLRDEDMHNHVEFC